MQLMTESALRKLSSDPHLRQDMYKSAQTIILENNISISNLSYDVFLSHSIKDAEIINGFKQLLNKNGITVYIDWIEDTQLDRHKVNSKTAAMLKKRMKNSKCLIYAYTNNATHSRWMPWECGYFDGLKNKVTVFPIRKDNDDSYFRGEEFLGLYPYLGVETTPIYGAERLYVNNDDGKVIEFKNWLNS